MTVAIKQGDTVEIKDTGMQGIVVNEEFEDLYLVEVVDESGWESHKYYIEVERLVKMGYTW